MRHSAQVLSDLSLAMDSPKPDSTAVPAEGKKRPSGKAKLFEMLERRKQKAKGDPRSAKKEAMLKRHQGRAAEINNRRMDAKEKREAAKKAS